MPEYVNCDLCGQDKTKEIYDLSPLKIVECLNCGLVYTNPRLNETERDEVYRKDYFSGWKSGDVGGFDYLNNEYMVEVTARQRLKSLSRITRPPGSLLEVGCATGMFLNLARHKGWSVTGIEISEFAAKYGRRKYNIDIINGDFLKSDLPAEFDVVTMYDLIEHTASPRETLQKTAGLLKPNGTLVLTVPDIGSTNARRLGRAWLPLVPQAHLYHFSILTLKQLLTECGFGILKTVRSGGTGLVGGAMRAEAAPFKQLIYKYFKYLNWTRPIVQFGLVHLLRRYDSMTVYARKQ